MAFGKKKHRGLKTIGFLLMVLILIGAVGTSAYMLYNAKISDMSKTYETEIESLKLDAYALKRAVWMSKSKLKAGTILQEDQLYYREISSSLFQNQFMTQEDIGKVLLIDVEPEVAIMKAMVFEEIIGKDTREEEFNMIFLPSNLVQNSFVDVRIGFPNGEDYIVLTKMKVRGINLSNNILWMWMDEKEILTLSSAIVDAYLHKGTKLYTVTYVAPTVQEEAVPNYPVNVDVLKIIQSNPNILEEARQGLSDVLRKQLEERLASLTEESLSNVESGIKQEISGREAVINESGILDGVPSIEREGIEEPTSKTTETQTEAQTEAHKPKLKQRHKIKGAMKVSFIKLGFVGSYKVDLFHYFSRILRVLQKKVLIVDASIEQDLQVTLPYCGSDMLITSQGVDYLIHQSQMALLDQIVYKDYDIILVDYGFNDAVTFDYLSCHILFLVTDFQKHHVLKMKALINTAFSEKLNVVKLFRDVVSSKIRSAYINRILDIDGKAKILAEYTFELNESDYACRLLSQYDDVHKFTRLSKSYKTLFSDIIEELFNLKQSEIGKAIKRAEGGKICK